MDKKQLTFTQKIGARMVQLRKKAGYKNHEAFAYEKGLSRSQYGRYEAGKVAIQADSLEKVIIALGVTVSEFFSEGFDD
jgi:transcriptional regulator with XRE-family HTH domain